MEPKEHDYLTTAEVAHALGVSPATVKRWCDKRKIQTHKTVGRHRRFTRKSVLQFARNESIQLAHPEALGYSSLAVEPSVHDMHHLLMGGEEQRLKDCLVHLYTGDTSFAAISDHFIAPILNQIGCDWEEGNLSVYQERSALEIMVRCLLHIRWMQKEQSPHSALAMGGTLAGNWYHVPNLMAEIVLRELGWRCMPLGNHLPVETLVKAIEDHQPELFWLSETHVNDSGQLIEWVNMLFKACEKHGTKLVIGGKAFSSDIKTKLMFTTHCENMTHFRIFLTQVFGSQPLRNLKHGAP